MGIFTKAADAVFPYISRCEGCHVEKDVTDGLCARCRSELENLRHGDTKTKALHAYSCYDYDGLAERIVRGYKYGSKQYLYMLMAREMAKVVGDGIDAICYVPLHPKRKKQRGFDQAELLAQEISRHSGIPFVPAIRRIKNTQTQTRLSEAQRQENIRGAFQEVMQFSGNVLLVDDVLTTGATAAECAKALASCGADNVYVMTFARAVQGRKRKNWLFRLLRRLV